MALSSNAFGSVALTSTPRIATALVSAPLGSTPRIATPLGSTALSTAMASVGHLASRRQLAALGFRRHVIDQALRNATLLPVRPGWVATSDANQLAVIAVLNGAQLTGATALRSCGVWAGSDRRAHLQLPRNAHRVPQQPLTAIALFTRPKFACVGVVYHWAPSIVESPSRAAWRVSIADALLRFARIESDEQIAAAIESAVHEKRMSRSAMAQLFHELPRRLRHLEGRLEFLSGSGLETVGCLRLRALGYRVVQQVSIGRDRVDLVIDGWLIVELDGDEWHDPIADRIRTNRLIRAGYQVLRFGYTDVFARWSEMLATIGTMMNNRMPVGLK